MKRLTKQQEKWVKVMGTSINPQEIMEPALKMQMTPFTLEKAKDLAELNKPEGGGALKMMNESLQDMWVQWMDTRDKQEFITLGLQIDPTATEEEMAELFDKSRVGLQSK